MRPIKTQSYYDNNFEAGGKRKRSKKLKGVSRTKLRKIEDRQFAPIERILRKMGERKQLKHQLAKGASRGDVYSFDDGEQDMVTGSCGPEGCAAFDEYGGESEHGKEKKPPLSLRLANSIAGFRQGRQDWMNRKKDRAHGNKDFGYKDIDGRIHYIGKNPLARARYKRFQRRIAKSEGRGNYGGFTG
tara:strand:+ start:161 stop:721 length:561 start_codon:yes stop_codon:yes gene_type:complete